MPLATSPKPVPRFRSQVRRSPPLAAAERRPDRGVLGRYVDCDGRHREVLARPGYAGSVLVIDRDASTHGDRRLVAHLGADEPPANAELVCRHYLSDPRGRWCRPISPADLLAAEPTTHSSAHPDSHELPDSHRASGQLVACEQALAPAASAVVDRQGRVQRLGLVRNRLAIPELRWLRSSAAHLDGEVESVSIREVVASLESYEPVRAHTARAIAHHREDPEISVVVLRAELHRLDASRIVLNRGLRHAVLHAVRTQGLSMSEIALRCGRIKYDARGNASGETSWLARRVGISPEGGEREPTPWVHSEVLALIARAGLGISPREVELG
jgi:hypothetical protein